MLEVGVLGWCDRIVVYVDDCVQIPGYDSRDLVKTLVIELPSITNFFNEMEARLHTATSSWEVYSTISVQSLTT